MVEKLIPDALRQKIVEQVRAKLTESMIEEVVGHQIRLVVDEVVALDLNWLEGVVLEKIEDGLEAKTKNILKLAHESYKQLVGEKVADRVRDLSSHHLREDIEQEASKVVPGIVREVAAGLDARSTIEKAIKEAVIEVLNTPVSELVKQQLGLIYSEFKEINEKFKGLDRDQNYLRTDIEDLKRKVR